MRFFIAFVVVLVLIAGTAYVVRRFGGDRLGATAARGRQPRLAVVDAAPVDSRRRLLLIRRDNVEHLLMIGGPTDVLVEANIVRAAGAPAGRPAAAPEVLPRAVPLGEGSMWPLQPNTESAVTPASPPSMARPARAAIQDEPSAWPLDNESSGPRSPRPPDPLSGLAAELARGPLQPDTNASPPRPARTVLPEREPARERSRLGARPEQKPTSAAEPESTPAGDPQFASAADQNLAEMAHRLEAALRRPRAKEAPPGEPAPQESHPSEPARSETPPAAESKPAQSKNVYDSLEQEMASLLGRPNEKT